MYRSRSPRGVDRQVAALGTSIKRARLHQRLSRDRLADRAGVAATSVHRVENGDPTVSVGVLVAVVRELGALGPVLQALHPDAASVESDDGS